MNEHTKTVLDWSAVVTAFSTFFGWLPNIAAGLAAIWTAIRLYEWAERRFWRKGD